MTKTALFLGGSLLGIVGVGVLACLTDKYKDDSDKARAISAEKKKIVLDHLNCSKSTPFEAKCEIEQS